jgi:tetratricopeptide (TPR) repeat protein
MKKLKFIAVIILLGVTGCEEFLDTKPDQALVVPRTLADVQKLLDNSSVFNTQPSVSTLTADEFWFSDQGFASLGSQLERSTYIWDYRMLPDLYIADWNSMYSQVFYANVCLDALEGLTDQTSVEYGELRGAALFYRAYAYYQLLQIYAPPYQMDGANADLMGIVLRDRADVTDTPVRSRLDQCYQRMIDDLIEAAELLPVQVEPSTRPSKAAAWGTLARIYLNTFDYQKAGNAAEMALDLYPYMLDFNDIDVESPRPFDRFNKETIFYSSLLSISGLRSTQLFVDTALIASYDLSDLRLQAYFTKSADGLYNFNKHLTGMVQYFGGITSGEMHLIAAEAAVRNHDNEKALSFLNGLLIRRYDKSMDFKNDGLSDEMLLNRVLEERKKELIGRGIRWTDLRRLNQESGKESVTVRILNGNEYQLKPNSLHYTLPIPNAEIDRSGIPQNPM